ncbi:MAG: isoleucine--tRNA ligase [Actinomycetota bacterium]
MSTPSAENLTDPGPPGYRPVSGQVNFPAMEERVLKAWERNRIFERSLSEREGMDEWVFYEGPPTANGKPGLHHVEARAFKDLFCRFQAMKGHYVYRKAGWDCHGLPVEVAVEHELGITQKSEIEEKVGIEEFANRCRESVQRYVDDWERLTGRIGFWLDFEDAYWTMDPDYIESVWWLLKQLWDKHLLEEDFKVVPYCPRCGTSLSSQEQHYTGSYQTVTDPSVYVRFPLRSRPDTALLVWTTTPWTLLANMAAAVGPAIAYVRVADPELDGKFLILAEELAAPLLGEDVEILEELTGADLVGERYVPPFDFVESGDTGHTIRSGEFVSTEEGSGIVHLAPYGEDDMMVARRDDLPVIQMIDSTGHVVEDAGPFAGMWFKEADPKIVEDMKRREVLWRSDLYEHSYPHCWRCGTPLIYYARRDWYIRTSQLHKELSASNEDVNWQPPTIKHGRFGDWLANNVDWSLSRDRYWGTPLPIWRCEDKHATCVGSRAELSELTGVDQSGLDPHRPYVDKITFDCPDCGKEARRVTSVIDAWFDSGSMPFAQWHYPFENADVFKRRFPADFISEAVDQTRGWFYSLLAIATMIEGRSSYRNVVCLGLLVDAEGRKMSKSLGNVIDPWVIIDEYGSDAMRWHLLTGGSPWQARRVGTQMIQESLRKYLLTLWNTYSFWVTYASLEGFDPTAVSIDVAERSEMDRWVLAELDDTVRVVGASLDGFDATRGGRRIERFVDDLSNWYVRRSRRRFWNTSAGEQDDDRDTQSAFLTLWECLTTVARLTAPFTPFVADEIYTNLMANEADAHDSVHLTNWPEPDDERRNDALRSNMALVRKVVTLGRAARTEAKMRVRQPLARALVVLQSSEAGGLEELRSLVAEELNVKSVEIARGLEQLVDYELKPNFKSLGPRFGKRVKDIGRALQDADAHELVRSIESSGVVTLPLNDGDVELTAEDLDIRVSGREGFSLAQDGPHGVALDLDVTDELLAEGIAREVVRGVQDLRKSSGLAVENRIELRLFSDDATIARALEAHRDYIAAEVLASSIALDRAETQAAAADTVEVPNGVVEAALRPAGSPA